MKYKLANRPIHKNEITISFRGPNTAQMIQLLQAFYFGATGEALESSHSSSGDKIGRMRECGSVTMLLDSTGEHHLKQFLEEIIDKW